MNHLTILAAALFCFISLPSELIGQIQEPELRPIDQPRSPLDEGFRHAIGFNVILDNFGFGVGAEYKKVLSADMEGFVNFRIGGLRDVSEQTFTGFFGQQVIPNKYQRAFTFPLIAGLRQRIFARTIADNYRFYLSGGLGPVVAFTYPYFNDRNNNGFREGDFFSEVFGYFEPTNDIFTGLGSGDWHLGLAGEIKLSMDVGESFSRLTSIQFGYKFFYFHQGIQLMQPNQPVWSQTNGLPFEHTDPNDPLGTMVMESFFDAQKFFGSPQISFIFGRMW